jgi:hypothetical protein
MHRMDPNILIAAVLVISFGIIFSVAYALDRRGRRKVPNSNLPPIGLVSRIIFSVALISLLVSILSAVAIFVYGNLSYATAAGGFLWIYIILGIV